MQNFILTPVSTLILLILTLVACFIVGIIWMYFFKMITRYLKYFSADTFSVIIWRVVWAKAFLYLRSPIWDQYYLLEITLWIKLQFLSPRVISPGTTRIPLWLGLLSPHIDLETWVVFRFHQKNRYQNINNFICSLLTWLKFFFSL